MVVKIEAEPTKITACFCFHLVRGKLCLLPKYWMVQENVSKPLRVFHPIHSCGGNVQVSEYLLFFQRQEPILIVPDWQVACGNDIMMFDNSPFIPDRLVKRLMIFGISNPSLTL